eukprot:355943-Chlamydomonas_euryale.AAC.13
MQGGVVAWKVSQSRAAATANPPANASAIDLLRVCHAGRKCARCYDPLDSAEALRRTTSLIPCMHDGERRSLA